MDRRGSIDGKCPVPLRGSTLLAGPAGPDLAANPLRTFLRIPFVPLVLFLSAFLSPPVARAEVAVQDAVAPTGREVVLRAETKSGFFSRGGALVEFFIDGKSAGKKLSGGDGVAYLPWVPARTGLHRIKVQSGDDVDQGLLLVVQRATQLLLIDVEGSLREPSSFSLKPRSGSVRAVKAINGRYPVIYVWTAFIGLGAAKSWLKESGFPEAPLLPWGRGAALEAIAERDLKIRAVVGKPDVVQSARSHTSRAFSFEAADHGETVSDWDELLKKVK